MARPAEIAQPSRMVELKQPPLSLAQLVPLEHAVQLAQVAQMEQPEQLTQLAELAQPVTPIAQEAQPV